MRLVAEVENQPALQSPAGRRPRSVSSRRHITPHRACAQEQTPPKAFSLWRRVREGAGDKSEFV